MITIELNLKNQTRKIELQDDVLFNALLSQNDNMIRKLIKMAHPLYKISDAFFDIVNRYVHVTDEGSTLYGGLIVRTGFDEFAVLYLENASLDDDYIVELVEGYLHDTGENISMTVNINKIEIDRLLFLRALK